MCGSVDRLNAGLEFFVGWRMHHACVLYNTDLKKRALLKIEVVQTLHTRVFTVLMEEVDEIVRANEDATKLTDGGRNVNHVSAHQNAELAASQLRRRFAHLTGCEEKLIGSTVEKAYTEIRKAQRKIHSVRTLARTHALQDRQCKKQSTC